MMALRRGPTDYWKLLRGGAPALISSGVVAVVPLTGALFLSSSDYAVWALVSTLSTIFIIFDFGTTSLATKLAAERRLKRAFVAKLALITAIPPIVLGTAITFLWPLYSAASGITSAPDDRVMVLIAAVAVGTTLRSIGVVYAAIALGRENFGRRTAILLLGALAQAGATLIALGAGSGYWSLGIGVLAGGVVQFVVGLVVERKPDPVGDDLDLAALLKRFVTVKGLATVLGLFATQLDRWALGLVAAPSLLASYDIAVRLATIPKIALIALAAGLISEGARSASLDSALRMLKNAQKVTALLYVASAVVTVTASWIMLNGREADWRVMMIIALVTVAQGVNVVTIAGTLLLTGVGHPEFELRYLVPLALLCAAAYGIAIATDVPEVLIIGWAIAMTVTSLIFVLKSPKYMIGVWPRARETQLSPQPAPSSPGGI
jgi:O-antigen/teichoic acid export membrane protein